MGGSQETWARKTQNCNVQIRNLAVSGEWNRRATPWEDSVGTLRPMQLKLVLIASASLRGLSLQHVGQDMQGKGGREHFLRERERERGGESRR